MTFKVELVDIPLPVIVKDRQTVRFQDSFECGCLVLSET